MNIEDKLGLILQEGKVAKARSAAIRNLSKYAKNISNTFDDMGINTDIVDASVDNPVAVVELQFGRNDVFKSSQVVNVTIYDNDDFSVELPVALSLHLGIDGNYQKFTNLRSTKRFLKQLHKKVFSDIQT